MDSQQVITIDDTPASPTESEVEIIKEEIHQLHDEKSSSQQGFNPNSLSNMRVRVELDDKMGDETGLGFMLDRSGFGLQLMNPLYNPHKASGEKESDWSNKNSQLIPQYDVESSSVIDVLSIEESDEEKLGGVCKNMNQAKSAQKCFNCGGGHMINECPEPKDPSRISKNIRAFKKNNDNGQKNCRYHEDVDQKFAKFQPGVLSESLRNVLGLSGNQLPHHIYNMRVHGYPPGWKAKALEKTSTLRLYGHKIENVHKRVSDRMMDRSRVYDYPGFNSPVPTGYIDECRELRKPPYNLKHSLETFIHQLSREYGETKLAAGKQLDALRYERCGGSSPPPGTSAIHDREMKSSGPNSSFPHAMRNTIKDDGVPNPVAYSLGRGQKTRKDYVENSPGSSAHRKRPIRRVSGEDLPPPPGEDPYEVFGDRFTNQSRPKLEAHRNYNYGNSSSYRTGNDEGTGNTGRPNCNDNRGPTEYDRSSWSDRRSHPNSSYERNSRRNYGSNAHTSSGCQATNMSPEKQRKWDNTPLVPTKNLDPLEYSQHLHNLGQSSPLKKKKEEERDNGYGLPKQTNVSYRVRSPSPSLITTGNNVDCTADVVVSTSDDEVMIITPPKSPETFISEKTVTKDVIQPPQLTNSVAGAVLKQKSKKSKRKVPKKKEESWEDDGQLESSGNSENSDTDDESVIMEQIIQRGASNDGKIPATSTKPPPPLISLDDDDSETNVGKDEVDNVGLTIDDDVIIENPLEPFNITGSNEEKTDGIDTASLKTEGFKIISISDSEKELLNLPPVYVYKNAFNTLPRLDSFAIGMGDMLLHETNEEHKGRFDKVLKVLQKKNNSKS